MRNRGWLCVHQQTSMGDKGRLKVHHNSCRCRRSRNRSLFNSNNKACNIKCVARFRFQQRGDCPEGVGGESWGWMLQIEQKLLRAFGRVPQHEIGALVHWASPFSLSLILFCYTFPWSRGRGTPEGVSTHALKQQTVVVGIEVGGQEKGVVEASFQLPVKLFGHAPWNGTERNLFNWGV